MDIPEMQLISALHASVNELQQGIKLHSRLITSMLYSASDPGSPEPFCADLPARSREVRFREVIQEAIGVLEESRKAFKSKRLEALRKRLTQVLIEAE